MKIDFQFSLDQGWVDFKLKGSTSLFCRSFEAQLQNVANFKMAAKRVKYKIRAEPATVLHYAW